MNWYFLNSKILNYSYNEINNILIIEMIDRICIYTIKLINN